MDNNKSLKESLKELSENMDRLAKACRNTEKSLKVKGGEND